MLDFLFLLQIVLNIIVLALIVGLLYTNSVKIQELTQKQLESVAEQSKARSCSQYQTIHVLKQIGRDLGIPVNDVVLPDITGFDCGFEEAP
jgi:uncharacterized membrane protein